MAFQLLPAETRFYDWFEKGSANLLAITRELRDLLAFYDHLDARLATLEGLERQGDAVVHAISDLLIKTSSRRSTRKKRAV